LNKWCHFSNEVEGGQPLKQFIHWLRKIMLELRSTGGEYGG
jgi:hypothetical protein